jgi:N-carbamoyl-L-amino-acid hydrolase
MGTLLGAVGLGSALDPVIAAAEGQRATRRAPARPGKRGHRPTRRRAQDLRVDGARLNQTLESLKAFGRTPEGGISRVAFSQADRDARVYVTGLLEEAGFSVEIDTAANLLAQRAGEEDLVPIMIGSHLDSVPGGGNYDGQVGTMGAVEVARTLVDADHRTRHPLEVVVFTNEEGGKTGSRAMAGEVEAFELDLETASGLTIGEGLRANGGDPDRLDEARRPERSIAAFLELHIEQGGVLDRDGIPIGVVEGIVGIRRWAITVEGFANHAGTTPMPDRRDALVAAARLVDRVNRVALEMEGRHVATVGRIAAEPGAPNVVPGRVTASLEIRDLSMEKILSKAAPTDPRLRDLVEVVAADLGLQSLRMPSGAGHDAQSIALLAPVGMIFVPSVDGISHSPRELSRPADIESGANVLLSTLLRIDREWD